MGKSNTIVCCESCGNELNFKIDTYVREFQHRCGCGNKINIKIKGADFV